MTRPGLMKLEPVSSGAVIRIVAPASFAKQERIDLGMAALRRMGYAPRFAENALVRGPLFFCWNRGAARD